MNQSDIKLEMARLNRKLAKLWLDNTPNEVSIYNTVSDELQVPIQHGRKKLRSQVGTNTERIKMHLEDNDR